MNPPDASCPGCATVWRDHHHQTAGTMCVTHGYGPSGEPWLPSYQNAVIVALAAAWRRNPQMRLMQLIENGLGGGDPFYTSDDDLARLVASQ